jgi:diguanylate cyclase (GGDEF)-like protein
MMPRRILLIDDDRLQYALVGGFLRSFRSGPWELETAADYAGGLKKILSGRYAVCLLDYRLGDGDGLALLREARLAGCTVPVVLLTADSSPEIDDAAMEAGAMDFLVKSDLTPRILEHAIRYAQKLGQTLAQLQQLATRDALTGLFNRREFQRMLEEECQRSVRFNHPFSLVMLDIDHFKKLNDTHGHQAGDEVLKHVASLLAGQVRAVDRVARYGGEEFAVLMVETNRQAAFEAMERLCALLAEMPCILAQNGLTLPVTLSVGIAELPLDAERPESLLAAADAALYAAKRAGRNRILLAARPTLPSD